MNSSSQYDATGVILVGGKSRRMGVDKAFMEFDGKPLFERVLEVFREIFPGSSWSATMPNRMHATASPSTPISIPAAPSGGCTRAWSTRQTSRIFVAPCDLPFPSGAVVRHLLDLSEGYDAVVPRCGDKFEPLFAVYSTGCRQPMRRFLEQGNFCIFDLYPELDIRYVELQELVALDGGDRTFINVNTPDEFARAEQRK